MTAASPFIESRPRATALPKPCGPIVAQDAARATPRGVPNNLQVASVLPSSTTTISCGTLCNRNSAWSAQRSRRCSLLRRGLESRRRATATAAGRIWVGAHSQPEISSHSGWASACWAICSRISSIGTVGRQSHCRFALVASSTSQGISYRRGLESLSIGCFPKRAAHHAVN